METAVVDTAAVSPRRFVERRRAGSVPPRGMVFVERRRPAPVLVLEADDLHAADHEQVLADGLDYGFGVLDRDAAEAAAAGLAGLIGPAALAAHALRPEAADLLA